MPLVLGLYVQLQLDMGLKMHPEVREKLVQGVYAVFDTTTQEGRRVLGEGMDASGRAVLGGLVRDWMRFGKWKGS
jgi:nucleolar pre-ribosomal-associated protein 2